MSHNKNHDSQQLPVGRLGIISPYSCAELGTKVDNYLVSWRKKRHNEGVLYEGYDRDTYLIGSDLPRFGSGEAKGIINESVRGKDLYLMVDVCNYSLTYSLTGNINHMSPDDHYQNLKRIIAAIAGKARRINVIMPFLYESRQHRRTGRESLDCAIALQELCNNMGVDNIITFDAHDPRVQNAIPLKGFENVQPAYQMIKALVNNVDDLHLDKEHMMVVSPDEGGMSRCIYYSTVLGLDLGMFYKRRDYSRVVNGRNPIVAHEYLGNPVDGRDIFIADDIIASGESMLDIAYELKKRNAGNIFCYATYATFTAGLGSFDKAVEEGVVTGVLGTNLTYRSPELLSRPWFHEVDVSKYIAYFIAALNHDVSVSTLIDSHEKIKQLLAKRQNG